MNNKEKNNISAPALFGEKGWTELRMPEAYGIGQAFITGDKSDDRIKAKYFKKDIDNSFIARIWFGPSTEGPPGYVHGGSMAAVLDEAMGVSVWLLGYTAVTAKITVFYRKMLHLDSVTTIEASVLSINGRKVITKGIIFDETGTIYTKSEGLFITIPSEKFEKMTNLKDTFF